MANPLDRAVADLTAAVDKETTDLGSFQAFVAGLKQALLDATAGNAAAQTAINAVMNKVSSNDQSIVDAMAANKALATIPKNARAIVLAQS